MPMANIAAGLPQKVREALSPLGHPPDLHDKHVRTTFIDNCPYRS
jgi:hypothetical protein